MYVTMGIVHACAMLMYMHVLWSQDMFLVVEAGGPGPGGIALGSSGVWGPANGRLH